MNHVLAFADTGAGDERRVVGRHAVVQPALRHDADQNVAIQIGRIGIGRGHVTRVAQHLPRSRTQKVLPLDRGECRLDARIVHADRGQNLLGISATKDGKLFLVIHVATSNVN